VNGWQGIFPIKNQNVVNAQNDAFMQVMEEMYEQE
jgi:uncharacterized lipoprotein YajG